MRPAGLFSCPSAYTYKDLCNRKAHRTDRKQTWVGKSRNGSYYKYSGSCARPNAFLANDSQPCESLCGRTWAAGVMNGHRIMSTTTTKTSMAKGKRKKKTSYKKENNHPPRLVESSSARTWLSSNHQLLGYDVTPWFRRADISFDFVTCVPPCSGLGFSEAALKPSEPFQRDQHPPSSRKLGVWRAWQTGLAANPGPLSLVAHHLGPTFTPPQQLGGCMQLGPSDF